MAIEDLKLRIKDTPISHIIGRYLALSKKGSNFVAMCPFHNDTHPSLSINDTKNMFMCFVDNTGGDAITFVQLYKNLGFIEALQDICQSMGWNFEDYEEKKTQESPKKIMAEKILQKAILIYKKIASTTGLQEFKKFAQERALNEETLQQFSIGISSGPNPISTYLGSIKDDKERSFALKTAIEIGIIRKSDRPPQNHYDTFRNRVMFPIWDQYGRPVGLGGRATLENQRGKYINSQESFLFNKKNILYGLNLAKTEIRKNDKVILVEGYMDMIALYQFGFKNTVAVMGTAMSDYAVNSLLSLTKNIYLCLDSDQAGMQAMTRINKIFNENSIIPKMINLGSHKDPDEFLQNEGAIAFQKEIDESKTFIDILIDNKFPKSVPELTDRKIGHLEGFFEILAPLKLHLFATEKLTILAKRLALSSAPAQILEIYKNFLDNQVKRPTPPLLTPHNTTIHPQAPFSSKAMAHENEFGLEVNAFSVVEKPKNDIKQYEKKLLQELIQNPGCLTHPKIAELLDFVDSFEVKEYIKKLRNLLFEIDESEYEKVVLEITSKENYSVELKEAIGAAIYQYSPKNQDEKVIDKMLCDLKIKLEGNRLKQKKNLILESQKNASTQIESESLLKELIEVNKKLLNINSKKT